MSWSWQHLCTQCHGSTSGQPALSAPPYSNRSPLTLCLSVTYNFDLQTKVNLFLLLQFKENFCISPGNKSIQISKEKKDNSVVQLKTKPFKSPIISWKIGLLCLVIVTLVGQNLSFFIHLLTFSEPKLIFIDSWEVLSHRSRWSSARSGHS